jgi:SAM-dependent methyltransferase
LAEIKETEMQLFDNDPQGFIGWEEDAYWTRVKNILVKIIGERIRDLQGKIFLEVGCGYSAYIPIAKSKDMETVGFDLSRGLLRLNQKTNRICGDAENLPFADKSIDFLLVVGVIHHVPDQKKMIQELARIVKDDGSFLIIEPHSLSVNYIYWAVRLVLIRLLGWKRVKKLIGFGTPHESFVSENVLAQGFDGFKLQVRFYSPAREPPIKFIKERVDLEKINVRLEQLPFVRRFGTYIMVEGNRK